MSGTASFDLALGRVTYDFGAGFSPSAPGDPERALAGLIQGLILAEPTNPERLYPSISYREPDGSVPITITYGKAQRHEIRPLRYYDAQNQTHLVATSSYLAPVVPGDGIQRTEANMSQLGPDGRYHFTARQMLGFMRDSALAAATLEDVYGSRNYMSTYQIRPNPPWICVY